MTCWPGLSCLVISIPSARSLTELVNCLTTLKLTSASSSARRISRMALLMSSSVSAPRCRTPASVPWSFSDNESNIGCETVPSVELDLLVIGSGPGGQRAAIQAAKLGKRVAIAERRNRLGGVSIHTGTIPSKTLRQATLEQLATRPLDVLDPTRVEETEQEAIQQLLDRAAAVVAAETQITREQFRRNRVGLLQGARDLRRRQHRPDRRQRRARQGREDRDRRRHPARAARLGRVRRPHDHRLRRPAQARAARAADDDRRRRGRDRRRVRVDVRRARDEGDRRRPARSRADVPRQRDRRGLPVPAAAPQRDVPAAREGRGRRRARGPRRAAQAGLAARRS